jgi:SAM-dependent methyltransferase
VRQSTSDGSSERFGYEWQTYAGVLPEYEEQFRRWLPFLAPEDWRNKRFIDIGCGMGRNSIWPMKYGAAGGVAVDIDERSLAAARINLQSYGSVQVYNCSVYDLPWRDEFDIAFSIGVIHHLEFPETALEAMVQVTKPGGRIAIWVYGRENNVWLLSVLDPARKLLFSRLPVSWVRAVSIVPTAMLWLMLRLGLTRIAYFQLLRTFTFGHLRSIVFDQMLPRIANYWTRSEVEALMQCVGLKDVQLIWVNEMSWAALGQKPRL